tara:strand:+ start:203 stop:400 length:198 start_codon:yes stop_codon:yes gene_type:complete
MELQKASLIATSMIAFSTFLGVLIALVGLITQIKNFSLIELFLYVEIYISVHLLFLYILVKRFTK